MDEFFLCVEAYRAIQEVIPSKNDLQGMVVVNDDNCELLQKLLDFDGLQVRVHVGEDLVPWDAKITEYLGKKVKLEVTLPRHQEVVYAKNMSDMLGQFNFCHQLPKHFFLEDGNHLSGEENPPLLVSQYLSTIQLVDFLLKISDHHSFIQGTQLQLVFFQKEKLEIDISYCDKDLADLPQIQVLAQSLDIDPHKDQRMVIFKEALITMLRAVDRSKRFPHLLENFSQIVKRYEDNFDLYVSEFSFEKVREEWEQRKIEYIAKFNQVITDTQDKILVIPVALILVGGEMEAKGHLTLKNVSILIGSIFFSVLMWILIRNQHHTLVALHKEVLALKLRTEERHQEIASRIEDVFIALSTRYKSQKRRLFLIQAIVFSGLLFSFAIFFRYTPETWWFFSQAVSLIPNPPF
ncbi:MAG: hypothetical protein H7829_03415 [Magnetococcus sp. THC-1_WYH]